MEQKKGSDKSKQLGIEVSKDKDFSEWYSQVIARAELIDYYDISGCYILRPGSYAIWEQIQNFFNKEIKKLGVQNAYFPLFVSERALIAEKDHIEGFAPEVAWVTKAGNKTLKEPIAIRPTSETIMYPAYSKWIRSHRDLPLKLNQWANVVRWEFKNPTPFLRSREFLWQEGHTAFATLKEADVEVLQILDIYRRVYEELLAVPVVKGRKTENEKFPGALYTTTVEAFIPQSGRGVQGATSHCLGQNFAKMFDIQFENTKGEKEFVWQNSWGLTTRSIGVMIMTHGDDRGLMLPPRVAPLQAVIVPIFFKDKDNSALTQKATEIANALIDNGIRAHVDDRENYNPGFKYNHWELKGVPIRLDFGPKDLENNTIVLVRRDNKSKETVSLTDLSKRIAVVLDDIHNSLFERAKQAREEKVARITTWNEFIPSLDQKKCVLAAFCNKQKCEDDVKLKTSPVKKVETEKKVETTTEKKDANNNNKKEEEDFEPISGAAKSFCIPFDQPTLEEGTKCFCCGEAATVYCLWGRSY